MFVLVLPPASCKTRTLRWPILGRPSGCVGYHEEKAKGRCRYIITCWRRIARRKENGGRLGASEDGRAEGMLYTRHLAKDHLREIIDAFYRRPHQGLPPTLESAVQIRRLVLEPPILLRRRQKCKVSRLVHPVLHDFAFGKSLRDLVPGSFQMLRIRRVVSLRHLPRWCV